MSKRRIRTLLRQGWHEVTVPRKNLYEYDPADPDKPWGDNVYMKEIIAWCQDRYDSADYHYSMPPNSYMNRYAYQDCFKRFVFRNSADAMMFKLKWSE